MGGPKAPLFDAQVGEGRDKLADQILRALDEGGCPVHCDLPLLFWLVALVTGTKARLAPYPALLYPLATRPRQRCQHNGSVNGRIMAV